MRGSTHREKHTPVLLHRPTASQETHESEEHTHRDQKVSHIGQLCELRWSVINVIQKTQKRDLIHLHPDS